MKLLKFYLFLFVFLVSCGRKTLISEEGLGASSTTSGTLKIRVSSSLVHSPELFVIQEEKDFTGSATNVTEQTFEVFIDEESLMFSKLKFEIEKTGDKNDCAVIYFQPYSYKKSISGTFKPQITGFDELNCSGFELVTAEGSAPVPIPVPKECYGGPAKDMVDDFPSKTILYTTTQKLTKEGLFTKEQNNKDPRIQNRYYVNDMDPLQNNTSIDQYYVADTMKDYIVYCRDVYGNKLLNVKIKIADVNSGASPSPNVDQYCTWSSGEGCGLD